MAEPLRLRFHRSLYAPDAVRAAAERFAGLAELRVEETDTDVLVDVTPHRESLRARIGDELGNHALIASILARRAAA